MSLKEFSTSKILLKQVLFAIALMAVLLFATLKGLKYYTHHGDSYPVPDLSGLTVDEAMLTIQNNNLKIEVIDSLFNKAYKPATIIDQQPSANSNVKANRTIFVTINSSQPERIVLPKLTDISFRQAQALIQNCGLLVGDISYQPSEYNDLVIKSLQNSMEVVSGDKVIKGTRIDLVVGQSSGTTRIHLPNLAGLSLQEALASLASSKLNQGTLVFDESVKTPQDSVNAKVFRQTPNPSFVSVVGLASSVDIWLTTNPNKISSTER